MANADRIESYATSYYTGTQASIWIGDIWVDEVFGIQFSASQSIIPIFGYASTFYDAVARGKVLVHGQFEINFIDEGYLYSIFNDILSRKVTPDQDKVAADVIQAQKLKGQPVEEAVAFAERARRTQVDVIQDQIKLLSRSAEGAFPDARGRRQTMSQILNELSQLDSISMDQIGNELERKGKVVNPKNRNLIYEMLPFTLKGYFGNPDLVQDGTGAMKEIEDCFLIGNEMIVDATEDVVKERYSFLARRHI